MKKTILKKTSDFGPEMLSNMIAGNEKGFIPLQVPVVNLIHCKTNVSLVSEQDEKKIEDLVYYRAAVVTNPGNTDLKKGDIISVKEKDTYRDPDLSCLFGAEGIKYILSRIDFKKRMAEERKIERENMAVLDSLFEKEDEEDDSICDVDDWRDRHSQCISTLNITRKRIDALYFLKRNQNSLFINTLSLFPLELRTLIRSQVECAPYLQYELYSLYLRIISRNSRLEKLLQCGAPALIINNESRILQELVDTLIANGLRDNPVMTDSADPRPMISLADILLRSIPISEPLPVSPVRRPQQEDNMKIMPENIPPKKIS